MNNAGKILIVDDEPLVRLNLRALLEDLSFNVIEAANGREALAACDRELPDLVLADLRMPEMDGLTLIMVLRDKRPNIPIIVISGTGSVRDAMEAVRRGAWDYITKPVNDQDTIEIVIRRTLERSRLMEENRRYHEHLEELVKERTSELHEQAVKLEEEIAERKVAQEALAVKQIQLERLNASLQERIDATIADLRQKDQMLIEQSRLAAMGEMISNIAHQWRQPLNNVGLMIQNIQIAFDANELTSVALAKEIKGAMDVILFMSHTIDDFRNFFRQDKVKSSFSVQRSVTRAIEFMSPGLKSRGIAIELEAEQPGDALGYANEYAQVLLNIICNAKDAFQVRNTPEPRICIRVLRENNHSVVTVRDNGGGIVVDILPKIFDPYFTTKHQSQGTGIGLYMSKVIIEQHMGGMLTARNVEGGAEFRIEL